MLPVTVLRLRRPDNALLEPRFLFSFSDTRAALSVLFVLCSLSSSVSSAHPTLHYTAAITGAVQVFHEAFSEHITQVQISFVHSLWAFECISSDGSMQGYLS